MTKETQPLSQVLAAASELLPTPPTASTSPPKSISPRTQPSFDFAEPATFRKQPSERLPLTQAEADAWTAHLEHIKYNLHFQRWYRWQNDQPKTPRSFTATEIRAWFEAEALRRLGEPFVVDEYNARIVELLCLYFAEDPRFEQVTDGAGRPYSLKKGLLLRGGVGTGKTTLLTIFSHNPRLPYLVESCRDMVSAYTAKGTKEEPAGGEEALRYYCARIPLAQADHDHFNHRTYAGLAFDDIATENWKAKHYGEPLNVVEHILDRRDSAVVAGSLEQWATHATTNVPFDDYDDGQGGKAKGLESIYGLRFRSRARKLFNIITFPKAAPDRRG